VLAAQLLPLPDSAVPDGLTALEQVAILDIRLPRTLGGALIGGLLGLAGVAVQCLFRNPLADTGLIGVSSGASLGAVACIVLGNWWLPLPGVVWQPYVVPVCAALGAAGTVLLVMLFARTLSNGSILMLLLAGLAVQALSMACVGILTFVASDAQVRDITFWNLGSLVSLNRTHLVVLYTGGLPVVLYLFARHRELNVLLLGEAEARHLGLNVRRFQNKLVAVVTVCAGLSVCFTGMIGFVGLVAPHLVRLVVGPNHRHVLGSTFLAGACLVVFADVLARTLAPPLEVPLGILTAFVGAPFLLWLVHRQLRT
jgi:iron complex transport system permease protein